MSVRLGFRLLFGELQADSSNSDSFQTEVNSKTEISRVIKQESLMIADLNQEGLTQSERIQEGSQIIFDISAKKITINLARGGENQPSKSGPGARAKADARQAAANRAKNSKAGN